MKPRFDKKRNRWWVDSYQGGRRRRWSFATKGAAERKVAQLMADRQGFGQVWLELEPRERAEVCAVLAEMRAKQVALREVWEAFKRGDVRGVKTSVPVSEALAAMLQEKASENLRPNYLTDLARSVRQFATGQMERKVSEFTVQDVRDFVAGAESPNTRATRRGRMMAFFSFCHGKDWTALNPVAAVKKPKVDRQPPRVLTIAEVRAVMAFVEAHEPGALAWFTLALFGGIRPEECDRVSWADVDFERGVVRLAAATHKTRKAHTVELPANAFAWVIRAQELGAQLPFPKSSRRKALRRVREHLGLVAWPQDVLRHSFCSYGVAARGQEWTAQMADHSEAVLRRHYRTLVSKAAATEFFSIEPPAETGKKTCLTGCELARILPA